MMFEHEPFIQKSKSRRSLEPWDVFFYMLITISLVILIVFVSKIHKNTLARHRFIGNDTLGFPMTTKGPLAPYTYSNLPFCGDVEVKVNTKKNWNSMQSCQSSVLQRFFGDFESVFPNFASVLYVCDDTQKLSGIQMKKFVGDRREYYVAMPKCQEKTTLVTLGIDEKAPAEKQLKSVIDDLEMYGTSPTGLNDNIFKAVFPFAIIGKTETVPGGPNGTNVTKTDSTEVEFEKYLKTELNDTKFVDILWINPANGPLEYKHLLEKDTLFDKLGLTVCQIGLEIVNDRPEEFYGFMLHVLNNPRYLFMRPTMSEDEKTLRFVLLNTVDERCYRKYVQ